jgi:ERCC4-type nuclease
VDSREQAPLVFNCNWIRKKLIVGDYGASFGNNHLHSVIWERKSIGDLFGSLTFGYERFRKMFERATKNNIMVVIAIEGSREKVLKGYTHSSRDPESILKQLETIERKYGVASVFFPSRIAMQKHIQAYYEKEFQDFKP